MNPSNYSGLLIVLLGLALTLPPRFTTANSGFASGGRQSEALRPPSEEVAALITVNTLTDENDGSCNDGDCSLRDAIQVANSGDTIRFSVNGFIVLTLGSLSINKNLTIEGPVSEFLGISAGGSSRVLYVDVGANVTLSDMEISDGVSNYGGGIYNRGNLTVNNCAMNGNYATTSGGGVYNAANGVLAVTTSMMDSNGAAQNGGGIDNQGTLTIISSEIRDNGTESGNGGGIHNQGTLTINGSTLAGNYAAANGGGIFNAAGRTATITQSDIHDNGAGLGGGGVDNRGVLPITNSEIRDNVVEAGSGGGILNLHTLTINSSTFAGNESTTFGGGIYVSEAIQTMVTNSTLHDNVSSRGGGIAVTNAPITVTNVTFFRNVAGEGGGGIYSSGTPSRTALRNTILAGSPVGGDCSGAMATTSTHNLATDASCSPGFTQVTTATLKLVWGIGWLGLESGSVAIDAGSNSVCPAADQRGVSRPRDGNGDGIAICDVGAYEFVLYRLYLPLVLRSR
ncbi:MAG: choice-of-anchor Q domain-containing protein [Chloroflexota bacterium]